MRLWREKLVAFAVHLAATVLLAAAAAALIFLVWFPDPLQQLGGGAKLFQLIVGCDLVLGPLMSLVIYDSRKSRRELVFDYTVVGVVQIAALVYGVYIVSDARPAYIAYVGDRYEVVAAGDLEDAELAAAREPQYRVRPSWGPRLVAIVVPPAEREDALFTALGGKDVTVRPKFYAPYESRLESLRRRAQPLAALEQQRPDAVPLLRAAMEDLSAPPAQLRWLPIKGRDAFWVVLVDVSSGVLLAYLPIDPYESP